MTSLRTVWMKLSLKRKILVMLFCAVFLTSCILLFSTIVLNSVLDDYESNMAQNSICYELQEALQEEATKFLLYTRERSAQNEEMMQEAFVRTEEIVMNLPYDYKEMGTDCYAITWNIQNGYEGYTDYRDSFLAISQDSENYVDELYRILEMQESLSEHALRLTEATLERESALYAVKTPLFRATPWVLAIVTSVLLVALVHAYYRMARDLADPLIAMAEDSRQMADHQYQTPALETDRQDEIGELIHAFNKMKVATGDYIHAMERLHEQEQSLEQARLEVLKSQVNPHFLFNTLNMISCTAKIEEAELTDKMLISMSNLFRYNLRTVEQEVYLEQELEVLEDYFYIQQMRFGSRLQYDKYIEVDETKVKIPSFTLQPLVENAFVHGISRVEEGGCVKLHIWMEEDNLMISIADNGLGMSQERLEEVRESLKTSENFSRGIGVGNICRRIHMLYEQGKFEIDSQEYQGTVVKITIPQGQR